MPNGYTLTYRSTSGIAPVDGSPLRPDTLGRLDRADLAAVTLPVGRERVPLGELFNIEGEPGDTLTLRDPPPLDHLGAQMESGELIIHGDAGDDLGASMSGGRIVVHGHCGERIGGPSPTGRRGMTGGEIIIFGDAGACAGYRMRRGLISIAGRAGKLPGYRMIAGTLALGVAAPDAGIGMKRGTIVCLDERTPLPLAHGFASVGRFETLAIPAIRLVLRRLAKLGLTTAATVIEDEYEVYSGDGLELNRGEVWQRVCRV